MKRLVTLAGFGLLALAGTRSAADGLPEALRDVGIDQRLNEPVPLDLCFHDELGRPVRLGAYFGVKPVVLVLAYYRCPMLCTQVLNGLLDCLRGLPFDIGDEFNVVTVSFDARETPPLAAAKKASYVDAYGRPGAATGWHFLTGGQGEIDRLTQAVGFRYKYDPKFDQFIHASGIMVLTPRGKLARYFYGVGGNTAYSPYRSRDLRMALVEASEDRIGSPIVNQVLLFCYHYDPDAGKYTPAAMNLVRLAGIVTVTVLAVLLGRAWRREARKGRTAAGAPLPAP